MDSLEHDDESKSNMIRTWYDLENLNDNIEKLIYPLEIDDDYDRGKINEFESQIKVF